ncbi:hypothetical protein DVH24_014814 [Malus domestica]|uniref:Uncharacterized protein n=1 Tax=Malus domestica TaxID=3750 RepID=A0A498K6C7_MALDO|nr:hypothetical protein DVH24_014814 [Malus domestica]
MDRFEARQMIVSDLDLTMHISDVDSCKEEVDERLQEAAIGPACRGDAVIWKNAYISYFWNSLSHCFLSSFLELPVPKPPTKWKLLPKQKENDRIWDWTYQVVIRKVIAAHEFLASYFLLLIGVFYSTVYFFKELPQFVVKAGSILSNIYGVDWENKVEVLIFQR